VITLLLLLALSGLIVGALGRLVVPGPNPMGLLETIAIGLGGSFLGGLIARLGFGWRFRYSLGFGFLISVLCAAAIVALLDRNRRSTRPR
jgi:uncharacterized membrane protein YeaQ/YmgE (transglycosylase-associated protein family)